MEIDRFAMSRAQRMQRDILAHYDAYEFHPVVAKLQVYCSEDLGAFYLDVLKDRLYTTAPKSLARRSAQTALWHINQAMLRWMAPFLSFTAEEAWALVHPGDPTIFVNTWHVLPAQADEQALLDRWSQLRAIRAEVLKVLEAQRVAGEIGSSLQAEVEILACGERLALQGQHGVALPGLAIASRRHGCYKPALVCAVSPGSSRWSCRSPPSPYWPKRFAS